MATVNPLTATELRRGGRRRRAPRPALLIPILSVYALALAFLLLETTAHGGAPLLALELAAFTSLGGGLGGGLGVLGLDAFRQRRGRSSAASMGNASAGRGNG